MCGLDMEEIGRRVGQPPVEALADLLLRAKGIADEIHYGMCEEDIEYIVSCYSCAIGAYTRRWITDGMKEERMSFLHRLPDSFEMTVDTLIRQCRENTYENR